MGLTGSLYHELGTWASHPLSLHAKWVFRETICWCPKIFKLDNQGLSLGSFISKAGILDKLWPLPSGAVQLQVQVSGRLSLLEEKGNAPLIVGGA